MSEIERTSSEQLAQLEDLLRERGAPVMPRLQPPATPESLAAVADYLGRPQSGPRRRLVTLEDHRCGLHGRGFR